MTELDNVVLENRAFIYGLAKTFENYSSKEDLFQAGAMGLIDAYGKYDPSLGVKFTSYAYPYVMGAMKKCIKQDRGIKVGRSISKLSLQIEKVSLLLSQRLMRMPTNKEIAEFLGVSEYHIAEALMSRNRIASVDEPIYSEGKPMSLHEVISKRNVDINTLIALKEELSSLEEPEKSIMQSRYLNDLTQAETAKALGISQVQVSRKEQKVIKYLRNTLM